MPEILERFFFFCWARVIQIFLWMCSMEPTGCHQCVFSSSKCANFKKKEAGDESKSTKTVFCFNSFKVALDSTNPCKLTVQQIASIGFPGTTDVARGAGVVCCTDEKIDNWRKAIWSGWWFQRFFIFTPIWGRFPFWLIFFKGVETTN